MSVFLHADLDAFFAAVEQLDFPQYRGKPVIVGGSPEHRRSVVSTASYEARKFGVHSAMPSIKAKQLCPNGIFLSGRMNRYQEKSQEVMAIFERYSPDVQRMSIDEAFIDLTGTQNLFGPSEQTAQKIKMQIKQETGLTVSIGMASNKYVAKIASGMSKPDGFFCVKDGDEEAFMLSLPIEKIWGAGEKTLQHLRDAGFRTTKDIHNASFNLLSGMFGKAGGTFLYNAVRGKPAEAFANESKTKSLSAERTFEYDLTDLNIIETQLMQLCQDVQFRLVRHGFVSRTVCLKIRYGDFSIASVRQTFYEPFTTTNRLHAHAKTLFYQKYDRGRGVRLLGISAQNCEKPISVQEELFDFGEQKLRTVEKTVIDFNRTHPKVAIKRASLLE